ncbi:MAG: CHAT domain-containing protein [Balneolaceae bacterium]|nr:CHAT domain-containing protein [Balneolaceae bacterium]
MQEAQEVYQQVVQSADELGYAVPQSILYNNLAVTYKKMGDFDQYLELQFQALNSIEEGEDYENHFRILENLFIHYRNTRNFDSALNYLAEARQLAADHGAMDDLAWVNLYTGMAYRDYQENYAMAEAYMDSASRQVNAGENYDRKQTIYAERGHLYMDQGHYDRALAMQDSILYEARLAGNQSDLLEAYITKARIYLELDDPDEAGRFVARFDTMDLSTLRFEQIVEARTTKSRHLYETGRTDEAYALLQPTMDQLVDWVRGSTELQTGYWNLAPEFSDAFQLVADLLIETGRQGEAVEVLDQLKSINDASLYQNPLVRSSILSESELTEYKQLTTQLDGLRRSLLAAADSNRAGIQQRIDELAAQKQRLDRRLSTVTNHDPVSVRFVQSRLSAREQVLHITELEDRYYIARITRRDVAFRTVPLDSVNRALFQESVEQIANKNTDLLNLHRISELMGFDELDPSMERVTVIPDSYLYQIPLDIMPVTRPEYSYSYGSASYLVEEVEVRYLTSLNDYRKSDRQATASSRRTGYAGYGISTFENYRDRGLVSLPYARREVENIGGALTNLASRSVYLDSASTEERFKATAPHARILHLATHSQVSDRDPLFSRIFMSRTDTVSGEEQFPGQIFAYELFELNLNNELIMLNSCESGSGGYLQGSGVMGISRALRYAGAQTLVLNLWSVNDMMASDFALQFYKGLNRGMSKPEALRQAKLHFLRNKNANPHFWGPYMMIGDSEPAIRPYEQWNYVVAGSFMLYFLLFVGGSLYYRRRNAFSRSSS